MNFNSLAYLVFLGACVLLYYLLPYKVRNLFLLGASYFFYMCWNPKYALLMLLSTGITYACGLLVEKRLWGKRKLWVALSLGLNLGILFFFKYFHFVFGLAEQAFALAGLKFHAPTLDLLLPVGISFYIFQALGYTVDVFRSQIPAEKSFWRYALFVSFFPQLVAGPIERSGHMLGQFQERHAFSVENLRAGAFPILWGLFKKMVLADNLAAAVNTAYGAPGSRTGPELLLATAAFAIQIYCDFSAYSDIARGSARLLGFRLMENFRCPYMAVSIQDFWRRWHISLSTWFRDYLYFPLGGSRCSRARNCLNLLIVFTVSGLWHGAALTFVVWGLLNGVYQVVSKLLEPLRAKWYARTGLNRDAGWVRGFRIAVTFLLTNAAWVLFRADSLSHAWMILGKIACIPGSGFAWNSRMLELSTPAWIMLGIGAVVLFAADWFITEKGLWDKLGKTVVLRYAVYFLLIAAVLVFGSYGDGYNPQDFVYFQF